MAKMSNLEATKCAVGEAALSEETKAKETKLSKITQKDGNFQVGLKKFPADWHKRIKEYSPSSVSDYILLAVREKMGRDGII